MKLKKTFLSTLILLITLLLFSCGGDSHDIDNIDPDVGVKIDNLIVPLKLDAISLQDMFNLEENKNVISLENGGYAILVKGDFHSDPVVVPAIALREPYLIPYSDTLNLTSHDMDASLITESYLQEIPSDKCIYETNIEQITIPFDLKSRYIDPAITLVEINEVATEFEVKLTFDISGNIKLGYFFKNVEIENLEFELPKGLTATMEGGEYNPETGRLKINKTIIYNIDQPKEITLSVSKINTNQAGLEIIDGDIKLESECKVISGRLAIYGRNLLENPVDINIKQLAKLTQLMYEINTKFANYEIKVTDFTGIISYRFDDFNIDPVVIDNLSDALSKEGTNISFSNPQIYVSIKNPFFKKYQFGAYAGVKLTPTPKSNLTFESNVVIDKTDNLFCLSPTKPEKMYVQNSQYVEFPNLGKILSGDGLPSKINVDIINAGIPETKINNLKLGEDLGAVEGDYTFYAPFELTHDSKIEFSYTIDGWSDDELKNIKVDHLGIESKVESDIPFEFKMVAYPIDKNGNNLTKNGQPVKGVLKSKDGTKVIDKLPASANTTILLDIGGPLSGIDGIILKATLLGAEGSQELNSNQSIVLSNIKLKVTGEYTNKK